MNIDQNGNFYAGDLQPSDRQATESELQSLAIARTKAVTKAQIDTLEVESKIPRVTREFMLDLVEQTAQSKGMTLEQLSTANAGYRKLKALDDQIKALRAQL